MAAKVWQLYDRVMDGIAVLVFPSQKYIHATLALYVLILAIGLVWYTSNWLWIPAVVLSMIMAWMIFEWFF